MMSTARTAGLVYLIVVLTGLFSLLYVPSALGLSPENPTPAQTIVERADLLRAGIAAFVVNQIAYLILPFVLHRLLVPSGRFAAALMVGFTVAGVPLALTAAAHWIEALEIATGASRAATFAPQSRDLMILEALDARRSLLGVATIFWGLWLAPLGYLILKSGALPRILGILLIFGCAGYLISFFGELLVPEYRPSGIDRYVLIPGSIGEIGTCLWLLIVGARDPAMRT